ncbi:uncharacterized protein LMH87_007721 [Akanthomyces muscarius]|uniref:Uncharacterized protein n=1 Tax=Akanthomyces muscarius TaxID=2231603 RepID=A0A9W8QKR2_AKAMU|nr:uncharacterized protein LMH87_007538 [Akanthomyces muscarius]XP_056058083.1 uncharacterized protein LMH87_007721 [Akanthomyces muscarius]KAJ4159597.1 hypothetical protein LMH87_007538 [Akanthomyces muscarius]KAJ4161699.1 hypothetical protein LMH87_007721 [Akanthomyces muscarius]
MANIDNSKARDNGLPFCLEHDASFSPGGEGGLAVLGMSQIFSLDMVAPWSNSPPMPVLPAEVHAPQISYCYPHPSVPGLQPTANSMTLPHAPQPHTSKDHQR